MPDIRVVLLMLALLPGTVLAQSGDPVPPPLVEVEDAAESAPPVTRPAWEGAGVEPQAEPLRQDVERQAEPLRLEAEPLRLEVERQADPPGRVVGRVFVESLSGTLAGTGGAFVGLVGALAVGATDLGCVEGGCDARGLVGGMLVGWSLGAATGVYGSGAALEGRGRFLPTLGLSLLSGGVAAGLYVSGALEDETLPLLFALPLVTSIVTYEVTSARAPPEPRERAASRDSGAWWTPTVGVSERGGSLGLVGRF